MKKNIIVLSIFILMMLPAINSTAALNNSPEVPHIEGPPSGKAGEQIEYGFCSQDPDGDEISYCIDWGDESGEICIGPFPSSACIYQKHTWTSDGTYTIKAKARDINGAESDWATLRISIPKTKQMNLYQSFIQRILFCFPFLSEILNLSQ